MKSFLEVYLGLKIHQEIPMEIDSFSSSKVGTFFELDGSREKIKLE